MFMIILSFGGILHMLIYESYTYILFPVSTLIWSFYTLIRIDEDEYCLRNDLNSGWMRTDKRKIINYRERYTYKNPEYKRILSKCKKNNIVSTNKVKLNDEK